ncbi:MAG: chromosome partitioning protein ParB family [Methylocystaceae bacterium]|nr:MAG: chromosome partitioning protein ParB family [Methylocystaceae bacterium]
MAKIVLTAARDIALDKLVASDANVRRITAGVSVEDLAEDISRRGLLQSLSVRPVVDDQGAETGQFAVSAGGRRLVALKLLVKQKRLAKNAAVPCIVKTDGIEEEDSLAENTMREALHPLDQFRAFKNLQDQGVTIDEIAARFFVGAPVVRQRLKLAAASEKLLDLYVAEELSLEQLMAFCVTDDHARQEEVWDAVKAGDKRAVFVGVAGYEAAGGVILRDLFQQDHGSWLQDVALLDRLAREKLAEAADALRAEGWKWSEIAVDFPYGHTNGLRRLPATYAPVSEEQQARYDAALAEYDALSDAHEGAEDLPEEVDLRLAELEKEIAAVDERPAIYDPTEISRAGIFVSIDYDGALKVERGFVRPEDEEPAGEPDAVVAAGSTGAPKRAGDGVIGSPDGDAVDHDETEVSSKLSDRLMSELTAHRTLALRVALANDPDAAFLAATHTLALKIFYASGRFDGCIEIDAKSAPLGAYTPSLADLATARANNEAQGNWQSRLPKKSDDLWDWLVKADRESTAGLFAFCVGQSVNALQLPHERRSKALDHADRLAEHVGLDMSAHWTPTVESYFGKVTKARILAAVREAKGEATVQMIDHLKKSDMAIEAERLLQGTGWLPEPLRGASTEADDAPIVQTEEGDALPDFLGDDDDAALLDAEEEEPHATAAE